MSWNFGLTTLKPVPGMLYDGWPAANFGITTNLADPYGSTKDPIYSLTDPDVQAYDGYCMLGPYVVYSDQTAGEYRYDVQFSLRGVVPNPYTGVVGEQFNLGGGSADVDWYELGGAVLAIAMPSESSRQTSATDYNCNVSLFYLEEAPGETWPRVQVKQWHLRMDDAAMAAALAKKAEMDATGGWYDPYPLSYFSLSGVFVLDFFWANSGSTDGGNIISVIDLTEEFAPFILRETNEVVVVPAWWSLRTARIMEV